MNKVILKHFGCVSDGRKVHRAAEVVIIIDCLQGCLQGYLLPFSSSRSEFDGEDLFYATLKLIPWEV